jgi:hypothetical protein
MLGVIEIQHAARRGAAVNARTITASMMAFMRI